MTTDWTIDTNTTADEKMFEIVQTIETIPSLESFHDAAQGNAWVLKLISKWLPEDLAERIMEDTEGSCLLNPRCFRLTLMPLCRSIVPGTVLGQVLKLLVCPASFLVGNDM